MRVQQVMKHQEIMQANLQEATLQLLQLSVICYSNLLQ